MSYFALSDSFEYLCYGSAAIINICTLTVQGSTVVVIPMLCVYRREILTTKVDPALLRLSTNHFYCMEEYSPTLKQHLSVFRVSSNSGFTCDWMSLTRLQLVNSTD